MKILLVVYDNGSYIHWFPQGLGYIAAVLLKNGYEIEIYNQDKNHYSPKHLTEFLNKNRFDVVGLGVIAGYYQYRKLIEISKAINQSRNRPFYILGGHGPSPEPEYFLKKMRADAIVIGEGEETVIELIEAISGQKGFSRIKGIAYRDGEKFVVNERRPAIKDVDSIPFPAFHLFPIDYHRLLRPVNVRKTDFAMPVLSARGCIYKCNFCYRMDKGYRPRSNESIIDEIELLKKEYGITYILFSDELLMSTMKRTIDLCESLIKSGLDIVWNCNGRLNNAKPEVLKLMKRAGCVFINYGIEAFDDEVLETMNKELTTDQIVRGINATLKIGISPGMNIIFGHIGDNKEVLQKGVDFILKYSDGAQFRTIRPVTPYPGSSLYYHAIEKGLMKNCEDFYENKHINSDLLAVNFTDLSDDEFHGCLLAANTTLIKDYHKKKAFATIEEAKKLYLSKNSNFRGFRQQ